MLRGKIAVVTGGGGGIGRAICLRCAQEGAFVVVAEVDEATGKEVAALICTTHDKDKSPYAPPRALFMHTDVTKEESVEACFAKAISTYGCVDVLVNNAVRFVFGHLKPPGDGSGTGTDTVASDEAFDKVMEVNVRGYARCIRHAVRVMRENKLTGETYDNVVPKSPAAGGKDTQCHIDARQRGSIVNVASVSSFIAQPEFVPYNASKGAVLQMTKCCAMDFAPLKIRVNCVSPGTVETTGSHAHMHLAGLDVEVGRKVFGDSCLLKRQAAPEEIASGVVFLASSQASFMTGANIVMDGGGTI